MKNTATSSKEYNLPVKKNKEGHPYIQLPSRLLKELNWKLGEKLEWIDNQDGSYTLKKYERERTSKSS